MHTCIYWEPGGLDTWEIGSLGTWKPGWLRSWGTWDPGDLGKLPHPKKCQFFIWPLGNFNKEKPTTGVPPTTGDLGAWGGQDVETDCNGLQQS